MARARLFDDWKFAHHAVVVTVMAICAAFFIFVSDGHLLVAFFAIVVAGLLAILATQLHVRSGARRRNARHQ